MIEIVKKCTLCGGDAYQTVEQMSGYVSGTYFSVYECSKCSSSFVDPMTNLQAQYETIYSGEGKEDSATEFYYYLGRAVSALKNPFKDLQEFSAIFWGVGRAFYEEKIPKQAKVLDVGSGLGYFTHALTKAHFNAEGLDYSDKAVNFARQTYGGKHTQGTIETFNGEKNSYDVLVAMETIEHVVSPKDFVASCLSFLKPGGKLILTTPIKDIHPKGTLWETEPAPIHLWWLTEDGMASIAKELGAGIRFVDFTPYTSTKVWWVHRGIAGKAPTGAPVVKEDGTPIHQPVVGIKKRVMRVLPPWLYIKLVSFYHTLYFLQKDKTPSKYMYSMCAVITKK